MVRSTFLLLLFVIIFLSGIIYGSGQDTEYVASISNEDVEKTHEQENHYNSEKTDALTIKEELREVNGGYIDQAIASQSLTFTQKTASFLERGVKGFYDVVVEILYQFSKLFF